MGLAILDFARGGFDFVCLVALLKRLSGGRCFVEVICEARLCAGFVYV